MGRADPHLRFQSAGGLRRQRHLHVDPHAKRALGRMTHEIAHHRETGATGRVHAVRADGKEILFNSGRPLTPGGANVFDIWVSTRRTTHEAWSAPVNLGPPV